MNIETKDELIEQISLAVEQIQKRYVLEHDIIKDCEETSLLCKCVDDILHHGLKDGLISWATEASIWPLLEKITCTEDIEQIKILHLKSNKEKCSAWIKMAVNMNLLGSYISTLHQDKSLLSHYYDYAFLRDPVLTGTVQSLLNYGIANFDFQITVDQAQIAKLNDESQKQEVHVDYDTYEQQSNVNGDDEDKTSSTVVNKESFNKKKRKKRKQPVINVVISDLDSYSDALDGFTVGLTNGDIEPQKIAALSSPNNDNEAIVGSDNPLEQSDTNNVNSTVSLKPLVGDLAVVHVSNDEEDSTRSQEQQEINENTSEFANEETTGDQMDNLGFSSGTLFESCETEDHNMLAKSLETQEPRQHKNTTNAMSDREKFQASETISRDGNKTRNEFSPSDFLLENSSSVASDTEATSSSSNIVPVKLSDNISDSEKREEPEPDETIASKTHDAMNFKNSEKDGSGEFFESDKSQPTRNDKPSKNTGTQSPLNYRVKKVENPEFLSSSYSSSYSDVTDTSYDERDLNFIPGIHTRRLSSSYKSGSSYDPKSSVSFDENGFPVFDSSHFTDSSSRPSSIDDTSGRFTETSNEWDMFDDLLNMQDEHFSGPDNFAGLTTSEELEIAIEHYKKMIKTKSKKSLNRDELVQKLVELRLRLQQETDGPSVVNPEIRKVVSHHFQKEDDSSGRKFFCDQCGKIIWILWQPLFTCKDCDYHSHKKCLEHIQRPCPIRNLSSLSYILDICPDTGLDAQQYRCAECRNDIAISKDGVSEARICDYTGQYFCDHCHWNDQVCIPARVVHNWDFSQYKVCRQTKQLLDLMKIRPLLNLKQINPMLFRYVEELREVRKLREDILVMKKYFLTCREALEGKLLIQLQKRQHFVDNANSYSFQDILDLNNDVLIPEISKIHAIFLAHIKADCQLCRARGFICEVCQDTGDVIFAFDPHTVKCTKCSAVFHKICFKPDDCPKCRRKKRVVENT